MKLACVAIVKNEERHIAEWIAYQFAIGFDTVILLDNQSTDATPDCARAFAPSHDIRVLDWHSTNPDYQLRAYEHAVQTFGTEFTWMAFFDTDEYLVIDPPFDLRAILNLWADIAAIGIPWAMFGSSRHNERPTGLLIEDFVYRSESGFGPNRHIKSIIRPDRMLRCENAHSFKIAGNYHSLAGTPLNFSQDGLLTNEPDYTLGKLHHYFTRSRDHWAEKMQRGYHDTTREASEFETYDRNEIFDDTAARHAPQVREILDGLTIPTADLTTSLRAQRGNPSPHTPALEMTNEQASSTFLQESSKELLNPSLDPCHRPGTWALQTEFGTLLTWNAADETISHCRPDNLAGHQLIFWRCATISDLVTSHNGHFKPLDPLSGQIVQQPANQSVEIMPGERDGQIAFKLNNGGFLSARPAASPLEAGTVNAHVMHCHAWECFTPIKPPTTNPISNGHAPDGQKCIEKQTRTKALPNPLYPSGFVIGWEPALLGNCLSSYANLFAFSERTGIPTGYQQLQNLDKVIETKNDELQNYSPKPSFEREKFRIVSDYINLILQDDVDTLYRRVFSLNIKDIKHRSDISGEIVFLTYAPEFKDLALYEDDLRDFCNRGNGVVMRGAYWYQYHDMRDLVEAGRSLRRLLSIKHIDGAEHRRQLMDVERDVVSIGIHMRRGKDYEDWINGEFYFGIEDYLRVMSAIHQDLADVPHRFYVCSDIKMDELVFACLPACYVAASLEDDFSALAKCDYVVGPPSTFGTWSAFLGSGRRIILTKERLKNIEGWRPIIEHSVDVIYPTGAYLPNDERQGPI
ncbi:MAG: hypothetical protein B7Z58_00465 [Acidiphilium sp. 37-64-53]|uniref:glycosyltransferase family 2 protein n=1 Tax=Acidiphilium TaxID=522 RepID=UPI000BC89238|nr:MULTISPECIES: glycosyltransferase family 2 protein [Acidiphilium]OYW04082.1 MAG: hypothetical protein B7Z58_00465 [Acidiphilium sp. 37-64-53]OZB31017.1 MAG: hypothetical protein B7X49_00005 [Acidiphilium sp. 34-64-41]HQT83321.1 glycosyltransferase family 2 protein [Acidiphilium rubrum]